MMAHITGLQGGDCSLVPLSSLTDCCAHAHSLTHTKAVDYSRWGVEGAALCSVSHSAVAPAHRLLPTAGSESDTSDSWRLRACSCRERHCMFKLSHTPLIPSSCLTGLFCFSRLLLVLKPPLRQCMFFLTGLEKQASELPGLCMLGFLFCVSMFGSRFGRNPVSRLQVFVFVLSAHNFRYWMDFTCYWAAFSKVYFCYQHGSTVTWVWYLEATWKHFYFWLASKEPGLETVFISLVLLP